MKRNFDVKFLTFEGNEIPLEGSALTLKRATVTALMTPYQDEQGMTGEEKLKRYDLAQRIYAGGEIDVTAEEVTLIKKLIGKAFAPLIVGPAYHELEKDAAT